MPKRLLLLFIASLLGISIYAESGLYTYAENSVLATGKWKKIKIANSGVYKLTYNDLVAMGFSDPSQVRVYGYGGAMLPEAFKTAKRDTKAGGDLPEVSVYKGSDYILFWGQGPISWNFNTSSLRFDRVVNPYSSAAYYFLTDSKGAPSDMAKLASTDNPEATITTFNDYVLHEKDLVNIGATGREFYGEDFSITNSQTFSFDIPGVTTTPMTVFVDFISKASASTSFKISVNDHIAINSTVPVGSADPYEKAKSLNVAGSFTNSSLSELFDVKIDYGKPNDINCRLNYFTLNMERKLSLYGSFTPFRNPGAMGRNCSYVVQNTSSSVKIWNITDGVTKEVLPISTGASIQFNALSDVAKPSEFVAVDVNGIFEKPEFVGDVANQNLHSLPQNDMVIICLPALLKSAERLAEMHRDPAKDNLKVVVVTPEQIYNEFSSGTPDATAYRWFLKMFYDRAQTPNEKPKYLLLFGDGSFDNRHLSPEWKSDPTIQLLLTYQSVSSLVETAAYVCDDYFGFLDDNEGANIVADGLDIGIGRFPVRTVAEADGVVNKMIDYAANTQFGSWKNNLCFAADDGDDNGHMRQADQLTQYLEGNYKQFVVNKVFLDSYKKVASSSGGTYPSAKKKLFDLLNSGVLAVNYTGHGSVNAWAVEKIMTTADIKSLNLSHLPLWITASCDFSRFDDFNTTAGEEVLLNPKGGGIGLITTTRVVYSAQNFRLNTALNTLLLKKNNDGSRPRLGDIIRQTKIALGITDQNKLNFTLLGDPALKLAYADYNMEITGVNGQPVSQTTPTFQALSEVTLSGRVLNPDGTFDPTFNGIVKPTVYDCEEDFVTLDNGNTGTTFTYKDRNKVLFAGNDSVRNGEFSFKFTVPKDMSYSFKSGRINLYGIDLRGNEAQGYFENFLLGGINPSATTDTDGPIISKMYLNDESFKSGDIVNERPALVVDLQDQGGLNVAGTGIGHDLSVSIDNSPLSTYVLNGAYEAKSGSTTEGRISYTLPEMSEGKHTLVFRAWDIQNNSSTQTISCVVKKSHTPQTFDLYTSNIVKQSTGGVKFMLRNGLPNTFVTLKINVCDISGTEVWNHTESGLADLTEALSVTWDLKATNGITVPPGIYQYRATVYAGKTEETTQSRKLIVIK